jgi:hypothetical protein
VDAGVTTKAKLRRKIRRLKERELALIIECNAARARAGQAAEALDELRQQNTPMITFGRWVIDPDKLDG